MVRRPPPLVRAALGTALAAAGGVHPGLTGGELRSGLRHGLAAAAVVTVGVGIGTAIPAVRNGMAARVLPPSMWKWLLLDIPLGTVWTEEAIYRGALGEAFGPGPGRLVQAVIFGLSHIPDARGAGESVLGTVVVTGTAGWVFGWLATRSGSLLAPALAHLAINEAGAVAALLVQRPTHMSESSSSVLRN